VKESDPLALKEFHNNRTVFRFRSGEKREMRFIEFMNGLCERVEKDKSLGRQAFEIAAKAYDLTLDKFSNLPGQPSSPLKADLDKDRAERGGGSDCRYYYKAYLARITKLFKNKPPASQIEAEEREALCMQGLVRNHFYKSQLEAMRRLYTFWSRYTWIINGGAIRVWLPVFIRGRKRGEWLAKNITDPDPKSPNEKQRIQRMINEKLVFQAMEGQLEDLADPDTEQNQIWSKTEEQFGISLAIVVADEKAKNIHEQRRSIRNLGEEKLKHLILRIFEDIKYDDYQDKEIATDFGLSKATFSRFAGSDWAKTKSMIPDLWLNTAKILSHHDGFREVALETGYLKEVETTLEKMHFLKPETDKNE
jgi:hypothetical protein